MDCASCAAKIDIAVRRLPGVEDVNVSVAAATMTVKHDDVDGINETVGEKVASLGYRAMPTADKVSGAPPTPVGSDHDDHDHDAHGHGHSHSTDKAEAKGEELALHGHDHGTSEGPWWKSAKGHLTIAAGVGLAVAWGFGKIVPDYAQWAFILAMLIGLIPIGRRAIMAAINGIPFTIETLMTIAAIGAVIIGAGGRGRGGRIPLSRRRAFGGRSGGSSASEYHRPDCPCPKQGTP